MLKCLLIIFLAITSFAVHADSLSEAKDPIDSDITPSQESKMVRIKIGTRDRLLKQLLPDTAARLKNIAKHAGIDIDYVTLPAKRALTMAVRGETDGDFLRHPVIESEHPSLLRVDVPLNMMDYRVWVHEDVSCMENIDALEALKPIGLRGVKFYEKYIYPRARNGFEVVNTISQAFRMLQTGRADYLVNDKMIISYFSQQTGISLKPCLEEPLFSMPMYLYLHESKRDLIPILEKTLRNDLREKPIEFQIGTRDLGDFQLFAKSSRKLIEAGKQLNLDIKFVTLPIKRSLYMANKGELDGEFYRTPAIEKHYLNLKRIDVPFEYSDLWLWVLADAPCIDTRKNIPLYKPVGVKGIKFFPKHVYSLSQVGYEEVNNYEQAFKMLKRGRADYFVIGSETVETISKETGIALKRCFKEPLLHFPFYLYLHDSHKTLIPDLTKAIKSVLSEDKKSEF